MTAKRPVPQGKHGTATGYQYGCRCDECRSAHAERFRNRRALGSDSRKAVERMTRPRPMGETERAVLAEVETMASPPREVDVMATCNLARILDNPAMVAHHARATKEFVSALYVMHPKPQKRKARRRLAAVQKMATGRTTK